MNEQALYTLVFENSLSATFIVPMGSELYFYVLLLFGNYSALYLHLTATAAGVAATILNWALGAGIINFFFRNQKTFSPERYAKLQAKFSKWGGWLLIFAWLDIFGMLVAFVAGMLNFRLIYLVPYALVGMVLYYYAQIAYFEKYNQFLIF